LTKQYFFDIFTSCFSRTRNFQILFPTTKGGKMETIDIETAHQIYVIVEADNLYHEVVSFLKKRGWTDTAITKKGGWGMVLTRMIPDTYPQVEDLIKAIRS